MMMTTMMTTMTMMLMMIMMAGLLGIQSNPFNTVTQTRRGPNSGRPPPPPPPQKKKKKCELGLENSRLKNKTPGRRATSPREVITFFATQTCRSQG